MLNEHLARRLLSANGYKVTGRPLEGQTGRKWSARARVIALEAKATLDLVLTFDGQVVTFTGTRKEGGQRQKIGRTASHLYEVALFAVETKHQAENS